MEQKQRRKYTKRQVELDQPSQPTPTLPKPTNPAIGQIVDAPIMREIGRATNNFGYAYDDSEPNSDFQFPTSLDKYNEMRNTPIISGLLAMLNLAVLSDEWSIQPAAKDTTALGAKAATEVEENLRAKLEWTGPSGSTTTQSFDDVLRNLLLCLPYGFAWNETVWRYEGSRVMIAKLAPRLPRTVNQFVTHPQNAADLVAIEQNIFNYDSGGFPRVPANKLTLASYNREGDNFQGRSLLRPLWQPYFLKDIALRVQGISIERNGQGYPVVESSDKDAKMSASSQAEANKIVSRMRTGESSGAVLEPGWQLNIKGVDGSLPDIVNWLRYLDRQQAIGAVMMILTAGLEGTGSYAQAEVQDDIGRRVIASIKRQIEEYINSGFLRQWWRWNYEGQCLPPEFHFANAVDLGLNSIVDTLTKLVGSTLYTPSPEDEEFFRKQMNLPEKKSLKPSVISMPTPKPTQPIVTATFANSPAIWQPSRKLTEAEKFVSLDSLRAIQDKAIARITEIFKSHIDPVLKEICAELKISDDVPGQPDIQLPESSKRAIINELRRVAQEAAAEAMAEIDRIRRDRKVTEFAVALRGINLEFYSDDIVRSELVDDETLQFIRILFNTCVAVVLQWKKQDIDPEPEEIEEEAKRRLGAFGFLAGLATGLVMVTFNDARRSVFEDASLSRAEKTDAIRELETQLEKELAAVEAEAITKTESIADKLKQAIKAAIAAGATAAVIEQLERSAEKEQEWIQQQLEQAKTEVEQEYKRRIAALAPIELYQYCAIMDPATCPTCADADGLIDTLDKLPRVPNPHCWGADRCRCFIIPVQPGGKA